MFENFCQTSHRLWLDLPCLYFSYVKDFQASILLWPKRLTIFVIGFICSHFGARARTRLEPGFPKILGINTWSQWHPNPRTFVGEVLCLPLCIDGLASNVYVVLKCIKNLGKCWENGFEINKNIQIITSCFSMNICLHLNCV